MCPYAIIQSNETNICTPFPSYKNGHLPYRMLTDTIVNEKPKQWISFVFLTYTLKQ